MTQEDKDLLLVDLCARLPYGVRGKVKAVTVVPNRYDMDGFPEETEFDVDVELQRIDVGNNEIFVSTFDENEDLGDYIYDCQTMGVPWLIEDFIPYLRTMSSMTEKEKRELGIYANSVQRTNFFYSHHIDCRFMIEKGLAIEAPEGMYKLNRI